MTILVSHSILDAIGNILISESAGRFSFIGPKVATIDSLEAKNLPIVSIVISGGKIDKNSPIYGPFFHTVRYKITIISTGEATVDLETINDEMASVDAKISALAALKNAEVSAFESVNSVIGDIFSIFLGTDCYDLLQDFGTVKKRTIPDYTIEDSIVSGDCVTVIGEMNFDVEIEEEVNGLTPIAVESPIADGEIEVSLPSAEEIKSGIDCNLG